MDWCGRSWNKKAQFGTLTGRLKNVQNHNASAEDLFKYRTVVDKTVPQRGGTKDYMPDGSWLQGKRLEKFHQEREAVLSEPRVQRIADLVKGEWNPNKQLVEFEKEMRNFWEHMGFVDQQRKWLHPEEALFLMETNVLEVWYGGIPLSIQQAYSMFLGEGFPLEYYQVYSHLRRIGYVVLRHQRSDVTKYERQIKLDTYLKKRERKRAHKAEKDLKKLEDVSHSPAKKRGLESDQDITTSIAKDDRVEDADLEKHVDEDEDMLSSVITEKIGNDPECMQVDLTETGKLETETETEAETNELETIVHENSLECVVDNLDNTNTGQVNNDKFEKVSRNIEIEHRDDMEHTGVQQFDNFDKLDYSNRDYVSSTSMEIDKVEGGKNTPPFVTELSKDSKVQREALRHSPNIDHSDQSEQNNVRTFQGLISEFTELHVWNIHNVNASQIQKYNSANWNFEEINFPDFGASVGDKTIELQRPDGKLIPGHFDLAQENYQFDRKEMINKKAIKNLPEDFDWSDEVLEFSYPEIMTDRVNVKKSCRNWTEYKNCQYQASASWDRSRDLPHLYGSKVRPVVLPEDATSTSSILDKLQIIQEEQPLKHSHSTKVVGTQKLVFDIYAPNIKFKKSAPGKPEHRVCVARCSDSFPNLLQISELSHQLQDDVPVLLALVDSGDVAFYELSDLILPVDITVG